MESEFDTHKLLDKSSDDPCQVTDEPDDEEDD